MPWTESTRKDSSKKAPKIKVKGKKIQSATINRLFNKELTEKYSKKNSTNIRSKDLSKNLVIESTIRMSLSLILSQVLEFIIN